jgi:hypothetical protein
MASVVKVGAAPGGAFSRHDGICRSDVFITSCKPGPDYRFPVGSGPGPEARRKETRLLIVATSSGRLFLDRVGRHHCPSPLHRHAHTNMHFSQAPAKGDISTLPAGGHFYFALTSMGGKLEAIQIGVVNLTPLGPSSWISHAGSQFSGRHLRPRLGVLHPYVGQCSHFPECRRVGGGGNVRGGCAADL